MFFSKAKQAIIPASPVVDLNTKLKQLAADFYHYSTVFTKTRYAYSFDEYHKVYILVYDYHIFLAKFSDLIFDLVNLEKVNYIHDLYIPIKYKSLSFESKTVDLFPSDIVPDLLEIKAPYMVDRYHNWYRKYTLESKLL